MKGSKRRRKQIKKLFERQAQFEARRSFCILPCWAADVERWIEKRVAEIRKGFNRKKYEHNKNTSD